MADEGKINWTLTVAKGVGLSKQHTLSFDVSAAAPAAAGLAQIIGTAAGGEAINLGDVATNGVGYFKNTDSANYVEIGVQVGGTFYPVRRLLAGEAFPDRIAPGAVLYARANTASVVLEYAILDA